MKTAMTAAFISIWMGLSAQAVQAKSADKHEARLLNRQALEQFGKGEYEHALAMFERAYVLHTSPNLLFNIAECRRRLGDREVAVYYYGLYLERSPNAKNREDVEHVKAELELDLADSGDSKKGEALPMPLVVVP